MRNPPTLTQISTLKLQVCFGHLWFYNSSKKRKIIEILFWHRTCLLSDELAVSERWLWLSGLSRCRGGEITQPVAKGFPFSFLIFYTHLRALGAQQQALCPPPSVLQTLSFSSSTKRKNIIILSIWNIRAKVCFQCADEKAFKPWRPAAVSERAVLLVCAASAAQCCFASLDFIQYPSYDPNSIWKWRSCFFELKLKLNRLLSIIRSSTEQRHLQAHEQLQWPTAVTMLLHWHTKRKSPPPTTRLFNTAVEVKLAAQYTLY